MPLEEHGWSQRSIASSDATPAGPEHETISGASGEADFDAAAAYLAQLGEGSQRTMREALNKLADWASAGRCTPHELPWHLLRIEHTAALRTRLASSLAPATANKHLAALRGVLKQCLGAGLMTEAAYRSAIDLPPVRGASPRRTTRLGARELRRLAEACRADGSPAGARDDALLALLSRANLRRSEAVELDLADLDLETGRLTIRAGSSGSPRTLVASDETRRALQRWILIRGPESGPLFNPVNKGGRIERRRLSEQAIYVACQKRAAEAGLPPISPEDLRRADPTLPVGNLAGGAGKDPSGRVVGAASGA